MPKLFDRVLLTLSCFGFAGILLGGFLNFAPNRLARGVASAIWQAPLVDAAAAIAGLSGLALLSFVPGNKCRSIATIIAAALILWGTLSGAGHLAALLMQAGPPAARASLGPAFWILISVALLAVVDVMQRGSFSYPARVCVGAVLCSGFAVMVATGAFDHLSLAREFSNARGLFVTELLRHVGLVGAATLFSLMIGVPLTVLLLRRQSASGFVFASLSIVQTIPSIALFGVLIAPMSKLSESLPFLRALGINGTGPAPAIIALTLYSLLPLVRGFYTGFSEVATDVKEAAAAIGFGARKIFFEVELPLALPVLISGLRVVMIQAIGLASVAALIGAGGLGTFIFQGIGQYALDLVLVGALPIILLALLANVIFDMLSALARKNL
ncbi:ABC transporter permease [Methylocapsa sp. D3K7]|uniref:ABC transporter permease n=1 Tax=Methylocapsa sp. D3K7 TaxID=3041435 RepID=UPI00244E6F4B|nr:ABC transporter permease [Methylocapsa sp. D3K7]WGJ13682.1 ABC transporter permease [Methylocapsa sp. D3K7]